jgi:small subunit ribosomal protein S19
LKKKKRAIWSRSSTIPEKLIGKTVFIHNGKSFIKSYITREKVGLKFGEFSYTRKFTRKENKLKNKKK